MDTTVLDRASGTLHCYRAPHYGASTAFFGASFHAFFGASFNVPFAAAAPGLSGPAAYPAPTISGPGGTTSRKAPAAPVEVP